MQASGLPCTQVILDASEFPAQLLFQHGYLVNGSRTRSYFKPAGSGARRLRMNARAGAFE